MPKTVELTIEIEVQKVSCPGVWLCQDGRVSLTVFALGTSYQTCLLPPVFPLSFRDVFYFNKRFQEGCALNNICCLLKDETIYCELVQWCDDCTSGECVMLAQYLGSLNDVLFPPNMCSSDGVDLLMRRTKDFPGILSPKIEIATKVRIDEIKSPNYFTNSTKETESRKDGHCNTEQGFATVRQRKVCHSPQYHRSRCNKSQRSPSRSRSRSSRSYVSKSNCSLNTKKDVRTSCLCPNPYQKSFACSVHPPSQEEPPHREYSVHSDTSSTQGSAINHFCNEQNSSANKAEDANILPSQLEKILLESRYIEIERKDDAPRKKHYSTKVTPCVCEICKKYHEIFHLNKDS